MLTPLTFLSNKKLVQAHVEHLTLCLPPHCTCHQHFARARTCEVTGSLGVSGRVYRAASVSASSSGQMNQGF